MTDLTLIHTAQVHCATFDALAPTASLRHLVRPDWLARAQHGIDAKLRDEIAHTVAQAPGRVLCSCTTIGEIAEAAGATRIDWPMMQQAAAIGGPVLMVYCLDSTAAPSKALLVRAFKDTETDPQIQSLNLSSLWPHFTSGDTLEFAQSIADQVVTALGQQQDVKCVVLAQASMAAAAKILQAVTDVPVLASPEIAVRSLLAGH